MDSYQMAKKRKLESKPTQLPQKIEEEEQIIEEEEDPEELDGEEAEEEVEYEEENEEEVDEEEEYANGAEGPGNDDDDEEPVQSVLSSFSKEALITLLSEAAERHPDVAERVRESAEADPSQRKIFVHGLKWDTTSEMLFEEFLKYGEIEDCRVVTDKATGRSKGYGFILFKSGRGARQALKEPQKVINNRMTSCQLASVGPVAAVLPQKQKVQVQQQSEFTPRKIYVSNVGAELDPKKLKAFFSKYGEIEEGPLGLDKETGKPKGFCLFVYKTAESAKWALAEPHKQFEGVTLHCQKAIDGPKSHKMQMIQTLKSHKGVGENQKFVDNVSVVGSTVVPTTVQTPPLGQQQQLLNVNPATLGQALTTLLAAQGAGFNLLGALGAVGAGTRLLNYPAVVPSSVVLPGLGSQVVQDGYGNRGVGAVGGISMGLNEMGGYGNQRGYPNRQKGQGGVGRSQHGTRPYMGQ
ncbi:hypothetical protein Pfo_003270 [Paulownia fortunei]|nr:hypothetical protein Pfo_003270 [Paulownia fortunei]